MEVLLLSYNYTITEDDALYDMLSHPSSKLMRLHMEFTSLSSRSAITLFSALAKGNRLRQLYLSNNNIDDEACIAFGASLKHSSSLVKLWITYNEFSAEAVQSMVQALCHNTTLQELQLSSYPEDAEKRIRSLQEEVNKNRESKECQTKLKIVYWY